jgi:hypothetical protein
VVAHVVCQLVIPAKHKRSFLFESCDLPLP